MKIRNFINVVRNALLIAGFLFLPASSVQAATNSQQTFTFLPNLEGLRFETPIKSTLSIDFVTELQSSKGSSPLIISSKQEPNSTLLDILIPTVLAEESTQSASLTVEEATGSAAVIAEEDDLSELPIEDSLPALKPPVKKIAATTSSPKPVASAKPMTKPTAIPESSPTPAPTAVPAQGGLSNGGLNADKVFDLVNNYRTSKGLTALQKDERACEVARSRAPEIGAEISGGYMHKGIKERNLPYWNSENIISMRTEEAAVKWWINDYIHRVQIEGDYQFSCVACHGNSCVQEFTNFQPKR